MRVVSGAMRTIAGATASEGRKMDRITPLPKEVRTRVGKRPSEHDVINQPELEPGFQFMLQYYGRPDTSALIRLLGGGGQEIRGSCSAG